MKNLIYFIGIFAVMALGSCSSQDTEEIKSKKNINGFNSIFAVSSIKMAKEYYAEFKKALLFSIASSLIATSP